MRPSPNLQRFIPAGAGNTSSNAPFTKSSTVYPRWRGEHAVNGFWSGADWRFIPAGAGNTPRPQQRGPQRSVYPRWRGEHIPPKPPFPLSPGLSPLARGTLAGPAIGVNFPRFIPAGAGNTPSGCSTRTERSGLSPLARGTHALIQ